MHYVTFDTFLHFLNIGPFKETFSMAEGLNRSPMPWGPLAAGGKKIKIILHLCFISYIN